MSHDARREGVAKKKKDQGSMSNTYSSQLENFPMAKSGAVLATNYKTKILEYAPNNNISIHKPVLI